MEGYITITELAERWGVNPRTIQVMCTDGRIQGASKFGNSWAIPADTSRPADGRVKTGKYRDWRKPKKKDTV